MTAIDRDEIIVLGRDAVGAVAESHECGIQTRYYLTDCCGASAKGCDGYIGCRACYREIDPLLGGVPDSRMVLVREKPEVGIRDDTLGGWWVFQDVPLQLIDVYGDGILYDEWKRRYLTATTK